MIKAPARSRQQRMDALSRANTIRSRRAQEKKNLKAGTSRTVDLLLAPPDWVETMKVYDLLKATPKMGSVKSKKVLTKCRISHTKTVGGLSQRQRTELCMLLRW